MRLRASAAVPPTVLAVAPLWMNTPSSVAEASGAAGVGADEVAQHHVLRRAAADRIHAIQTIAGDDVAGARDSTAHRVGRGAARKIHALVGVAEGGGAGDV